MNNIHPQFLLCYKNILHQKLDFYQKSKPSICTVLQNTYTFSVYTIIKYVRPLFLLCNEKYTLYFYSVIKHIHTLFVHRYKIYTPLFYPLVYKIYTLTIKHFTKSINPILYSVIRQIHPPFVLCKKLYTASMVLPYKK